MASGVRGPRIAREEADKTRGYGQGITGYAVLLTVSCSQFPESTRSEDGQASGDETRKDAASSESLPAIVQNSELEGSVDPDTSSRSHVSDPKVRARRPARHVEQGCLLYAVRQGSLT